MERCPECHSMFIEWDNCNQRFRCLEKKCLHTWQMKLREPVENDYLRITLGPNKKYGESLVR